MQNFSPLASKLREEKELMDYGCTCLQVEGIQFLNIEKLHNHLIFVFDNPGSNVACSLPGLNSGPSDSKPDAMTTQPR